MFSPDLLTKIEKCHDSVNVNKMVSKGHGVFCVPFDLFLLIQKDVMYNNGN